MNYQNHKIFTINQETPKEINPYHLPLIILIIGNVAHIALLFMLYFLKTTCTLYLKNSQYGFRIKGLFFNADIGVPLKSQVFIAPNYNFGYSENLILVIHDTESVYTIAEKFYSSFDTNLQLYSSDISSTHNVFQLYNSSPDSYLADIARKLDLIKY